MDRILRGYGVDIEHYFLRLLESLYVYPEKYASAGRNQCIHIGRTARDAWTLHWEWIYDSKDTGFLIVSKHTAVV